jgi:transposase-like protein
VQLALTTHDSLATVAQQIGVHRSTLRRWVAEHRAQVPLDADASTTTATTMLRPEIPVSEQLVRARATYPVPRVSAPGQYGTTTVERPRHAVESRRMTIELMRVVAPR